MKHIELHTLPTEQDAYVAEQIAGLITFNQEEFCENCDRRVAFDDLGEFIPCVVVLTDESTYFLCEICSQPVAHPGKD